MMKMLVKTLKAKKNKTAKEQEMIKMISGSYDISDRKYIEPILKCLENKIKEKSYIKHLTLHILDGSIITYII